MHRSDIEKWFADASQGVIGGCDLDCGRTYANFLPGAVRSTHGWINRSSIDQSVERIVKHTIMLGLLDEDGECTLLASPQSSLKLHRACLASM